MQVNIQKIEVVTKTSAKTGKPYKQIEMFTAQHGQKKLTKFVDKDDKVLYWRAGDVVNIVEIPNGNFMNFAIEELRTNANSGAVITPPSTPACVPPSTYNSPAPYTPPATNNPPESLEFLEEGKAKVDRNYELLLRIAQHVGVILTEEENNHIMGF